MRNQWTQIGAGGMGVIAGRQWSAIDDGTSYVEVQAQEPATDVPFHLLLVPMHDDSGQVVKVGVRLLSRDPESAQMVEWTAGREPICTPDEVRIDDAGLLQAIARGDWRANPLNFCAGFTAQLAPATVPTVREAIAAAFDCVVSHSGAQGGPHEG